MSLWLVGAGKMAQDYARVLDGLRVEYNAVGRGMASAASFENSIGRPVWPGGVEYALERKPAPVTAIIAVGVEYLAEVSNSLICSGTKRILVEKPGGLHLNEIIELNAVADKYGASVFVGYNRRFYGAVRKARSLINEDGGVLSAHFEFTEWAHVVTRSIAAQEVKERWLMANSSHVIDTAFHLIGRPIDWKFWNSGSIDWHPAAARFCGAGLSDKNVMFSYISDWQAPGRWGIELLTPKRRLILRPMERLSVIQLGSVELQSVDLVDDTDLRYKPGLYLQTQAFLNGDDDLLCSLDEQVRNASIYSKMAGY